MNNYIAKQAVDKTPRENNCLFVIIFIFSDGIAVFGVYSQICFDLLMENREFSVMCLELCHHLHERAGIGGLTLSG